MYPVLMSLDAYYRQTFRPAARNAALLVDADLIRCGAGSLATRTRVRIRCGFLGEENGHA
jgi:hypothetical protein